MKVLSREIKRPYPSVYGSQELDILYNHQGSKSTTGSLVERIVELQL